MKEKFKDMSYEEFFNYCEERACDGRWGLEEAVLCLGIIKHMQQIRIYTFMFYDAKKTKKAREDEWERMKKYF
mgnify:FL=1